MGVNPVGDGGPPQFLEWGDEYLIIPPPHFLTCVMNFCFLVIQKPNAWYAIHKKL